MDICPACYTAAQAKGNKGPRYAGAEHQKQGVRVVKKRASGKRKTR